MYICIRYIKNKLCLIYDVLFPLVPPPSEMAGRAKGSARSQKARPRAGVFIPERQCGESYGSKLFIVNFIWRCCRSEIQISSLSNYIFKLGQQHTCICFCLFINTTNCCYFWETIHFKYYGLLEKSVLIQLKAKYKSLFIYIYIYFILFPLCSKWKETHTSFKFILQTY